MNKLQKFKSLICNKETRLLYQEPGESILLKNIITYFDVALIPQIPNIESNNNDYKRKIYITNKIIHIVDSNSKHTFNIRSILSDPSRLPSIFKSHVAFEDPLTFNYWNKPSAYFDILVAENPVRLEMLKTDGLLLDEGWFKENEEELEVFKIYPYKTPAYVGGYGRKIRRYYKLKKKRK